jgi:hypothetical protein
MFTIPFKQMNGRRTAAAVGTVMLLPCSFVGGVLAIVICGNKLNGTPLVDDTPYVCCILFNLFSMLAVLVTFLSVTAELEANTSVVAGDRVFI